jgi:hypothetical protein
MFGNKTSYVPPNLFLQFKVNGGEHFREKGLFKGQTQEVACAGNNNKMPNSKRSSKENKCKRQGNSKSFIQSHDLLFHADKFCEMVINY